MRYLYLRLATLVMFSSAAVIADASASTLEATASFGDFANRIGETSTKGLPFCSNASTPTMCDLDEGPIESSAIVEPLVEPLLESQRVDPEGLDALALNWLETEMQMSIDPTNSPQAILPDDKCVEKPWECPYRTKCEWVTSGGAWCVVTSCGTGSCPICPSIFPNVIVKSWCAYGCMNGTKTVGGAFMIQTRFRWIGPFCIPA